MKKTLLKAIAFGLLVCIVLSAFAGCKNRTEIATNTTDIGSSNSGAEKNDTLQTPGNNTGANCSFGHAYGVNDLCENCGARYQNTGLVIAEYQTHCCVISYMGTDAEVTIPAKYKGKPVLSIGDEHVFSYNLTLKSVKIPAVMEAIGNNAFEGCKNLTTVTFQTGSKLTLIGSNTFQNCTSLTSITLPETVTHIGEFTFSYCTALKSIKIPDGVEALHYSAFAGCTALESVTLPSTLVNMEHDVFLNCSSLKSMVLPDHLTRIRGGTFSGCTALAEISLPAEIGYIEANSFTDCTSLTTVRYRGTVSQWFGVSRDSTWDDSIPAKHVTCNNGAGSLS